MVFDNAVLFLFYTDDNLGIVEEGRVRYQQLLTIPAILVLYISPVSADDLRSLSLEELLNVQVSSRRIDEDLRKVPRSITVLGRKQIQEQSLASIYDLAPHVPNFSMHRSFSRWQERPLIRGVSSANGVSPVGVLMDGVSLISYSPTMPLHDLERVEVIRGPEAALYGRATFAGAINFVPMRPSAEMKAKIKARSASNSLLDTDAFIDIPLGQYVKSAVSGRWYQRDNHVDANVGNSGSGYGEESSKYAALSLLVDTYEPLSLYYRGTHQDNRDGHMSVYVQNSQSNNCYLESKPQYYCGRLAFPQQRGFNISEPFTDPFVKKAGDTHLFEAKFARRGEWRLVLSQSDMDINSEFDGDLYELNAAYSVFAGDNMTQTAELIADYQFTSLRLLSGLTYLSQETAFKTDNHFVVGDNLVLREGIKSGDNVDNYGIFAGAQISLNESLTLDLDLRFSRDKVTYFSDNPDGRATGSKAWNSISPRISLSKNLAASTFAFASIAKGSKPGGFNRSISSLDYLNDTERERLAPYTSFEQESLISYELGYKAHFLDDRHALSAGLYYYDWQEQQLTQSLSYRNASDREVRVTSILNSGDSASYGGEFEYQMALTEALRLKAGVGVSIARFNHAATTANEDLTGSAAVNGNQIPNAPDYNGFIGLHYNRPVGERGELVLNAHAHYESKRFIAEHNLAYIDARTDMDLRAAYSQSRWQVAVFVKNALDSESPASGARFGDAATFFQKRAFGISLPESRQLGAELTFYLQ